jgi:hypothetical protein
MYVLYGSEHVHPSIPIPTEKLHPKINFKLVGIGGRNTINNKGWRLKTFSTQVRVLQ